MAGSKKPKFPALYRMRPDLTWTDVHKNWKERKPVLTSKRISLYFFVNYLLLIFFCLFSLLASPMRRRQKTHRPMGFWKSVKNWRSFFCDVAEAEGFDPMVADNWVSISRAKLAQYVPPLNTISHYISKAILNNCRVCRHYFRSIRDSKLHCAPLFLN